MPDPAISPYLVPVYVAYGCVAIVLTIWLARVLFKNGAVFLQDVFKDQPQMADAVNRLLVVGFYLFNLGYAALIMKARGAMTTVEAAEVLAWKLGALLVSLGVMHFFNMYLFYRIRRRRQIAVLPPPVEPQMRLPHPGARHPWWANQDQDPAYVAANAMPRPIPAGE